MLLYKKCNLISCLNQNKRNNGRDQIRQKQKSRRELKKGGVGGRPAADKFYSNVCQRVSWIAAGMGCMFF